MLREPSYLENQSTASPPKGEIHLIAPLLEFILPYKSQCVLALLSLILASGAVLVLGIGIQHFVDTGFSPEHPSALYQSLFFLFLVVSFLAIGSFGRFYFVSWIGERLVADLRKKVFSHLLSLSPNFFETARVGEIVSHITTDSTLLQVVTSTSIPIALRNILMLVGGLVMLLLTSLKLTIIVLLVTPIALVPVLLYGRQVRKLSKASHTRLAQLGGSIEETFNAIRTSQAFCHEREDRRTFSKQTEASFKAALRQITARAFLTVTLIILVFGAISLVLWIGGNDIIAQNISAGELTSFLFYALVVAGSAGALSEIVGDLQRAAGATERLIQLLNTQSLIKTPRNPKRIPAIAQPSLFPTERQKILDFNAVDFAYPSRPKQKALKDFSLQIEQGEKVALVGPSGAGKSTVFQLALRFYDPTKGKIAINGCDLKQADPRDVRHHIALVPQDPFIFSATVFENIHYGQPSASRKDVEAAAKASAALEFIEKLPEGFDTHLGAKGIQLSGGQRQRIAIARALLKNAPLLLLDEATSALDATNERLVQQAISHSMEGRTTIIIAHRLATVQKADRIIVMDQGKIIAVGTHADLVAQEGIYQQLANLEFLEESKAI
ncbi:MAG: ATP-binding cassette domain-containing protein [Alphaproteobacteria bacterium]|jgi:ATP-binding cassette, subfamily B, bacterial|nr:ATP-binding cassette domain-containing protein [Alphaproteobacteria bacterium]MBT5390663.1 ATP-binding cassette domain-containing protein [Alphaproteobacteria bacterium]MBT5541183.1 ATP-binding cassette domain-containing protein [Alphaproteobacteria bacterium]MBT5654065.1 ATP-binding cassette domain-containing protein [Alphaproteobacteria bacterium]